MANQSNMIADAGNTFTNPNACYDTSNIVSGNTYTVGQSVTYNGNSAVILKARPWNVYNVQDLVNDSFHEEISGGSLS